MWAIFYKIFPETIIKQLFSKILKDSYEISYDDNHYNRLVLNQVTLY